jgi:hypothetical protein
VVVTADDGGAARRGATVDVHPTTITPNPSVARRPSSSSIQPTSPGRPRIRVSNQCSQSNSPGPIDCGLLVGQRHSWQSGRMVRSVGWRLRAVVLVLTVGAAACTTGRSSLPVASSAPRTPADPGEVSKLRLRPMTLPILGAGERCPVTTEVSSPSKDIGQLWGTGPARPVLGGAPHIEIAPPANYGSKLWGGNKVLWALSADSSNVALVRGRQLDGPAQVGFDQGDEPALQKILDPSGRTPLNGGWFDFPGAVRLEGPGCYAFQIDRGDKTWTIVFSASKV